MKRLRRPPLRQIDIDAPIPSASRRGASWREVWEWLESEPGGVWTFVVVFILFALAMWGIWAAWQLPIVRELWRQ